LFDVWGVLAFIRPGKKIKTSPRGATKGKKKGKKAKAKKSKYEEEESEEEEEEEEEDMQFGEIEGVIGKATSTIRESVGSRVSASIECILVPWKESPVVIGWLTIILFITTETAIHQEQAKY